MFFELVTNLNLLLSLTHKIPSTATFAPYVDCSGARDQSSILVIQLLQRSRLCHLWIMVIRIQDLLLLVCRAPRRLAGKIYGLRIVRSYISVFFFPPQ